MLLFLKIRLQFFYYACQYKGGFCTEILCYALHINNCLKITIITYIELISRFHYTSKCYNMICIVIFFYILFVRGNNYHIVHRRHKLKQHVNAHIKVQRIRK